MRDAEQDLQHTINNNKEIREQQKIVKGFMTVFACLSADIVA